MAKQIRKICVKFFTVGNKRSSTSIIRAGKNRAFTAKGIDNTLAMFAAALERRVPTEEFRLVCVGSGCYNFVWDSTKPIVAEFTTMPHLLTEADHLETNENKIVLENGSTIEFGLDRGETIVGLSDFGEATVEVDHAD